jgi:hypothetical protein
MRPWKIWRAGKFGWQLDTVRLGMGRLPAPSLFFCTICGGGEGKDRGGNPHGNEHDADLGF